MKLNPVLYQTKNNLRGYAHAVQVAVKLEMS
jgi:hypothetical protein